MALSAREEDLARVLVGSRMLKRQRMRRLLLAHLLREKREAARSTLAWHGPETYL